MRLFQAQLKRYRTALMDAIKQGGTNMDEIKRITEKINSIDNNLLENNGKILQMGEQLSSLTEDLEDSTIALNTEVIAIQENLNSTINQLDQQRSVTIIHQSRVLIRSLVSLSYCLNQKVSPGVKSGKLS